MVSPNAAKEGRMVKKKLLINLALSLETSLSQLAKARHTLPKNNRNFLCFLNIVSQFYHETKPKSNKPHLTFLPPTRKCQTASPQTEGSPEPDIV
jgi:hypothetical protein